MLVAARGAYPVAAIASVELDGPDFRYASRAQVARRGDGVLGMRFLSCDGLAERSVRSLVAARLHRQQLAQPARCGRAARDDLTVTPPRRRGDRRDVCGP